jgi:phage regulator Rha-like protein
LQAVFFGVTKMQIVEISNVKTMTSLEISEVVKSRHDKVKQSIERLSATVDGNNNPKIPVMSLPPMGEVKVQRERREEVVSVYLLPKRESYIVVAQLSPEFTADLVDRWQELEAKQAPAIAPIPKTRLQLAKENVMLIEEIEAKDALLLEQAPKVAIYEILADRKQDVSTTLIAKQLGTTAIKLNHFLRESGVKWLNADLPKAGYSEWFNVVSDVKNGHEFHQCLITPLGQIEITKLWTAK